MTTNQSASGERTEGIVQVLILLAVGGMAAAASFTHVHDWTMHNAPTGTGDWFGWANATISDLVPLGVGLEVRRRRRHGLTIGPYPIIVILAAAALSLAGQLAQATPSPSGWLLAAVPALGFLALTKLILSRPTTPATKAAPVATTTPVPAVVSAPVAVSVDEPRPTSAPEVPGHLPGLARFTVVNHEQRTGRSITADELADALATSPEIAAVLLAEITGPRVNGARVLEVTP